MTQFKVGDKVRLVKAREEGKFYDEPDFYNSWEPEMTQRVKDRDEGVIEDIAGTGIRVVGWDYRHPPDSFELVRAAINWDKPLQTREGDAVTIITREGRGKYSVIGYVGDDTGVTFWLPDGRFSETEDPNDIDIINVPEKPVQKEVWLNVFKNSDGELRVGSTFTSRAKADSLGVSDKRVACIKVVLTEGQFDN